MSGHKTFSYSVHPLPVFVCNCLPWRHGSARALPHYRFALPKKGCLRTLLWKQCSYLIHKSTSYSHIDPFLRYMWSNGGPSESSWFGWTPPGRLLGLHTCPNLALFCCQALSPGLHFLTFFVCQFWDLGKKRYCPPFLFPFVTCPLCPLSPPSLSHHHFFVSPILTPTNLSSAPEPILYCCLV
jgi:hypothetical protein